MNHQTAEDLLADDGVEAPPPGKPGDWLHFLVTGFTFLESNRGSAGMVSRRGQEVELTDEIIEANRGRNGFTFTDLLHDPDGQLARWGQIFFAAGAFPAEALKTVPGELEHEEARRRAARAARTIVDAGERAQALRSVEQLYGPAVPTSRTLGTYAR